MVQERGGNVNLIPGVFFPIFVPSPSVPVSIAEGEGESTFFSSFFSWRVSS